MIKAIAILLLLGASANAQTYTLTVDGTTVDLSGRTVDITRNGEPIAFAPADSVAITVTPVPPPTPDPVPSLLPGEFIATVRPGLTSNPATWGGTLPTAADDVQIIHDVTIDSLTAKRVEVARGTANLAGTIDASGSVIVRTKLTGSQGTINFHVADDRTFKGGTTPSTVPDLPDFHIDDTGLWALPGGVIDLDAGDKCGWASCTALTQQAPLKYGVFQSAAYVGNSATLDRDLVGWAVGDRLLLTNETGQHTTATLASINGRTITYTGADAFTGRVLTHGTHTIAPKVANLTRPIKVVSADVAEGDFNHRAHCLFMTGSTAKLRGVEAVNLGARAKLGRYPFHWHMGGKVVGLLDSCTTHQTVTDPGSRFVSIHHVQGVRVEDCVGYKSRGHGYFLEDRHEVGNKLLGNLSVDVQSGEELPNVDSGVTPLTHHYWVRVGNEISGNVAVGGDALGLVILAACPSCVLEYLPAGQRPVVSGQECYGVGKYGAWSMVANVDFNNCTLAFCGIAGLAADPTWGSNSNGVKFANSFLAFNGDASADVYKSQAYLSQAQELVFDGSTLVGEKGIHTHYNVTFSVRNSKLDNAVLMTPTYWDQAGDFTDCEIKYTKPFDNAYPISRYTIGCLLMRNVRVNGGQPESFDLVGKNAAARFALAGTPFGESVRLTNPLPPSGFAVVVPPAADLWQVEQAGQPYTGGKLTTIQWVTPAAWQANAAWMGYGLGMPPGNYQAKLFTGAGTEIKEVQFTITSGQVTQIQ